MDSQDDIDQHSSEELSRTETYISWAELHRDARCLARKLSQKGTWRGVIAIARGGLIPGSLIARELSIKFVDTVCVTSYTTAEDEGPATVQGPPRVLKGFHGDGDGYLIIDDLVDTGETARLVRGMAPRAHFATLYAKPKGMDSVDTYVREYRQDEWLYLPWDTECKFTPPIRSDGPPLYASHPGTSIV